jgi:hypothetical protein
MKSRATAVLTRSLKISRAALASVDDASDAAWARKPSREHFLDAGRHRNHHQPRQRGHGHPGVARAAHLDQDRGPDAQRHGREQLIGDTEQGPERVDAAQRIHDALIEEVPPPGHD